MRKSNKVTQYEKWFSKFLKEFGFFEYTVYFDHFKSDDEDDGLAYADVNVNGKVVTTGLNLAKNEKGPKDLARHEVIHVLVGPVQCVANKRFVRQEEVDSAAEETVCRIERILENFGK